MTAILEARDLVVSRGGRVVLRDASLALKAGEAVALVGPNAAGKSTFVRALAGLLQPTSGLVLLEDRPIPAWPRDALARTLSLVTPEEGGAVALTVRDRVALGRYPYRGPFLPFIAADDDAVERSMRQTGILELAGRRIGTLSAGERQLAALARGLAQEPRVLLLDEPGAHLDVGHQLQLFRVLDAVRECGVAVLAVVHDLQRAAAWCDRMILLAEGRVRAEGPPRDVLASSACAEGFGVEVRGHTVPSLPHLLYSFEDKRP